MPQPAPNPHNFVAPEAKAKSGAASPSAASNQSIYKRTIAKFVRIARAEHLDYEAFTYCCRRARRVLGLRKPRAERILPQLLTAAELDRFYRAISETGDIQHELMLKLLYTTGVRVSELVGIRVGDVDVGQCTIFIRQGKGDKDRVVLFPKGFCLTLRTYLGARPKNTYLFESRHHHRYSPRRIQQIIKAYGAKAGITRPIYPHLLRHQILTHLTHAGLSDAQIQLISGHASKQALEVYQHLSLECVGDAYQDAVRDLNL